MKPDSYIQKLKRKQVIKGHSGIDGDYEKRNCLKAPESEQKQEASFGVPTVKGGSCLELLTFTVFRVWADTVKMRQVLGVPVENNGRHSCLGNQSAKPGQPWKLKLGWGSPSKEKSEMYFCLDNL